MGRRKKQEPITPVQSIPGFKKGVESSPGHYLILAPDFTIIRVSDIFLENTMTMRGNIVGRNIFDVFPDNPHAPETHGVANLRASFMRVMERRQIDIVPLIRYDIPKPRAKGSFEERYWQPVNFPLFDKFGNLNYIVHNSEDVTRQILRKKDKKPASYKQTEAV